jgi:hypothetical protein
MITINRKAIAATGTTTENEPIIKSDGAGEVMQWKPSDDGADGIFVEQVSGIGGLCLGVGVTPTSKLSIEDTNKTPTHTAAGNLDVRTTDAQGINVGGSITLGGNNDDAASVSKVFGSIEGRKSNASTGDSSGYLKFNVGAGAGTLPEIARITSTGLAVTGAVTATTLSTFSAGIAFQSATGGTGTSSVGFTLDKYESGIWTPTDASGQTLSLTVNYAVYTRVGNLVTLCAEIVWPSVTNAAQAKIGGLPFTLASGARAGAAVGYSTGAAVQYAYIYEDEKIYLYSATATGATLTSVGGDSLAFTATYLTA